MPAPYPIELRKQIMAALDNGTPLRDVMREWNVSRRTIYNYLQLARETGDIRQRPGNGGRRQKLDSFRQQILEALEANPQLTMKQLQEQLNLPASLCTLSRTLSRWNIGTQRSRRSADPPETVFGDPE